MGNTKSKEWQATLLQNIPRGGGYHLLSLQVPRTFPRVRGGEFLMLSVTSEPSILLRRPMAIYDLKPHGKGQQLDILYAIVGRGTEQMERLPPGTELNLFGPIGNTFSLPSQGEEVAVVAGGIGIAPFLLWSRHLSSAQKNRTRILLGFRDRSQLPISRDFPKGKISLRCAVEGTGGDLRGTALDLLQEEYARAPMDRILTCGPEKMMDRVIEFARRHGVSCEVSLEAKMACGMGVCLSCVTDIASPPNRQDYSLVCQDGPIFTVG